ncbi:MAG: hypothetical protein RIR11_1494 [Bacteroidota bacterium]|jgi:hypothetical protein
MRLLLLALISSCLLSCNKDDGFEKYVELIYRESFEIPAGVGVFDVPHLFINDVPSKYLDLLRAGNMKPEEIEKVLTIESTISGIFGDEDLGVIDRISLRVIQGNNSSDFIEIAYRDPAPNNPGNGMGLIPSLSDSKAFISQETINFEIVIWLRANTTQTIPLQLDLKMRAGY